MSRSFNFIKGIRVGYLLTLVFIALMATHQYRSIQKNAALQSQDALRINVSGKQRAFSQIVAKEALLLEKYHFKNKSYKNSLVLAIINLESGHQVLLDHHTKNSLAGFITEKEVNLLKTANSFIEKMKVAAFCLAEDPRSNGCDQRSKPQWVKEIIFSQNHVLSTMDAHTKHLELIASKKVETLSKNSYLDYLILLSILFANSILIFEPTIRKLKSSLNSLLDYTAQSSKLSNMALIGQLSSGISHEVNNCLAVIQGSADALILKNKKEALDKETINRFGETIISTTKRIHSITRTLKKLSKENQDIDFEHTDLDGLISDAVELTKAQCKQSGIDIRYTPPVGKIEIECNIVGVSQVIVNLVKNSYDEVKGNPNSWIQIGYRLEDSLKIIVTDSGLGIAEDLQDKIMRPFYSTKKSGEGSGMGLSFCLELAKAHCGDFYLDKGSKNTQFIFEIPINQTDPLPEHLATLHHRQKPSFKNKDIKLAA